MKRVGTIVFSFIAIACLSVNANAQTMARSTVLAKTRASVAGPLQSSFAPGSPSAASGNANPLSSKTDTISYFQDTTGGNWWVYVPVLSQASGDSLGYYGVSQNGIFYYQNEDTIGPTEFKYINSSNVIIDTTPFDTMYYRVMALRVSPPKDITPSSLRLSGGSLTFFPVSFNPADRIRIWVVPIRDEQFLDGNTYPIPDLFGKAVDTTSIPSDSIVVGQINTVYVSFRNKVLSSVDLKNEFGICIFDDGPGFRTDTLGYLMDQNLQSALTNVTIDTDGSLGVTGEPMRTYHLSLDGGNMVIQGQPNYVGGGGGFFIDFGQIDPTSGQPTGAAFDGNLLMNTYFTGISSAVNENGVPLYSLDGNYPNPVGTSTAINYTLAQSGPVTLMVYNTLGEQVRTVVNSVQGPGEHTANFTTGTLPNGMYYYKLQSGDFTATRTMVIDR